MKKIKQYAVAATIAGACLIGQSGYAQASLPVDDSIIQKTLSEQSVEESYESSLDKARVSFNEGISDQHYTVAEQAVTHGHYLIAKDNLDSIESKTGHKQSLPGQDKNLQSLLDENLEGLDYGRPELEYELRNQGLDVEVEKTTSKNETSVPLIGLSIAYAVSEILNYKAARSKSKQDEQKTQRGN